MAGRDLDRANRIIGAMVTGLMAVNGLLWLESPGTLRAAVPDEHARAAIGLAQMATQLAVGAPAGWLAGVSFSDAPYPVIGAMAGTYVAPAVAWFLGYEPAWPISWVAAAALSFGGSWLGYGIGLLARLARSSRKPLD
ncbi:MAG: hypothetical protein ACPLPT_10485 [Moorellales bacterium]